MHKKRTYIITGSTAAAGIVYLACQPGGRLVPLAVLALIFGLIGAYFGFVPKGADSQLYRFPYIRYRLQAASVIFVLLALGLAYWSRLERDGIDHIAEWITPYPAISQVMAAPRVSNEYLWMWIAETPDSMDKVIAFYQDKSNIGNWRIAESGRVFTLHQDKYKLVIMLSKKNGGTGLLYKLSERQ